MVPPTMHITPLDNSGDMPGRQIFCRTCDRGRSAQGAYRALDKVAGVRVSDGIDIFCAQCVGSSK